MDKTNKNCYINVKLQTIWFTCAVKLSIAGPHIQSKSKWSFQRRTNLRSNHFYTKLDLCFPIMRSLSVTSSCCEFFWTTQTHQIPSWSKISAFDTNNCLLFFKVDTEIHPLKFPFKLAPDVHPFFEQTTLVKTQTPKRSRIKWLHQLNVEMAYAHAQPIKREYFSLDQSGVSKQHYRQQVLLFNTL